MNFAESGCIYKWYSKKDREWFEKLLLGKAEGKKVDECITWLDSFDSWNDFVEKNYLQDFVNVNQDGSYGEPKAFWKSCNERIDDKTKKIIRPVHPQTEEDFEQFFTNATACIVARGMRISKAMNKKEEGNDNQKEKHDLHNR